MGEPYVIVCTQLCTPCLGKALREIPRYVGFDITALNTAAPTSWSCLMQLLHQYCLERRIAQTVDMPNG